MNPSHQDCQAAAGLLPDFWKNQLDAPERAGERLWLHQHLESCPECAGLAGFWARIATVSPAPPSQQDAARARQRLDQMLAGYAAAALSMETHSLTRAPRPARRDWFANLALHPLPALAAVVLLAVGLGAGWLLHRPATAPVSTPASQQIAELRDQVQTTRQLVVLSLLQQQQANDRLQGVMYSTHLQQADPQVTSALLRSLNYDASPDVRLAAVDALTHEAAQPEGAPVREGLLAAFHHQTSPLVQIALLDTFVSLRDRQAHPLLEQVSKDAALSPEVRQRAVWALAQPAWN